MASVTGDRQSFLPLVPALLLRTSGAEQVSGNMQVCKRLGEWNARHSAYLQLKASGRHWGPAVGTVAWSSVFLALLSPPCLHHARFAGGHAPHKADARCSSPVSSALPGTWVLLLHGILLGLGKALPLSRCFFGSHVPLQGGVRSSMGPEPPLLTNHGSNRAIVTAQVSPSLVLLI
jgi:hypothetical protein